MMSSSISIAMISPSSNWSFLGGAGGAYSRAGPVPFFLLRGRAFPYEWLNLLPLLVFLSPLPQYTSRTGVGGAETAVAARLVQEREKEAVVESPKEEETAPWWW